MCTPHSTSCPYILLIKCKHVFCSPILVEVLQGAGFAPCSLEEGQGLVKVLHENLKQVNRMSPLCRGENENTYCSKKGPVFTFTTDSRVTAKNNKSSSLKGKTTPSQNKTKQKTQQQKTTRPEHRIYHSSIRSTTACHLTRNTTRLSSSWVCTKPQVLSATYGPNPLSILSLASQ